MALEGLQIVQAEQAPIGDQDQSAQIGKSVHHLLEDRQQGLGLCRVAVEDLVVDRQSLTGLHHAKLELASDQTLFGHSEFADVALDWTKTRANDHLLYKIMALHFTFEATPSIHAGLRPTRSGNGPKSDKLGLGVNGVDDKLG